MNVDKIANSLLNVQKQGWKLQKPIVCRLRGEGEDLARQKLKKLNSKLLHIEDDWE